MTRPFNLKEFTVAGSINLANGKPAAGINVVILNKNLRSEKELGRSLTNREGQFTINYTPDFPRPEHKTADIFFRLSVPEGQEITGFSLVQVKRARRTEISNPQVLFNASDNEKVEITLTAAEAYRGPAEFDEVRALLTPLLENVPVESLSENDRLHDISFLAGETGFAKEQLNRFVIAHRLAIRSKIEPEYWYALFAGSVYTHLFAGFRSSDPDQQMGIVLATLTSVSSADATKILSRAIDQHIIRESWRGKIAGWVAQFIRFVGEQLANPDANTRKVTINEIVRVAGIDSATKEQFIRIYQEHTGALTDLWKKLRDEKQLPEKEIAKLETAYELTDLLRSNFQAARVVRENFRIESPAQVKALAKMSKEEWIRFIADQQRSGNITIPEEIIGDRPETKVISYATTVAENFKETFPTTAFLGSLERALQSKDRPAIRHAEQLQKFLADHPDFDLLTTRVDPFFQRGDTGDATGLRTEPTFREDLKSVQRIFKLAPDYEAANTLLRDDLHAAAQIYRLGKASFVKKYEKQPGFNTISAKATYNKAANTHAAVMTLVGELKALESAGAVQAMNDNEAAVNAFPNWQNLFGKADICECEHCRSVYSPGAYFADILMFLKNRTWGIPAPFNNVKEVLLDRRPDLGYLELSCENANTPLPYIDVVNEVLESVIAAGADEVELAGLTTIPANPVQARTAVANAFLTAGIILSTDFTLADITGVDEFVVHDTTITYLLKKKASANYYYEITRQTKISAAELKAYPQYVKPTAYTTLSSTVYPRMLPFDLFNDEVRSLLEKAGVPRWQLMKNFLGNAAPNNPTAEEIAAAYFNGPYKKGNAQPDEGRVLLIADANNQFLYWGETSMPAMLSKLRNVEIFLQRTGLEYNDMLVLFDLEFINPDKSIQIIHLDPSCDTDKKEISNLDQQKMDRIHRFLRLWRKSGWKMWEIDRVIMHPQIGAGLLNESFLVQLMYFAELKNTLGKVSVEELCSLFGTINTATKFKALHEPRTDSLYHTLFLNKLLSGAIDEAFEISKVDVASSAELISKHLPVVQGALKLKEKDLLTLTALTKASDDSPYNNDQLTLTNLSFLYRHTLLSKLLKWKMEEWNLLLKLLNIDLERFNSPEEALDIVTKIRQVKTAGFNLDELNYLLSADLTAKSALKEKDLTKFLIELRKGLKDLDSQYNKDEAKYDFLHTVPPTDIATNNLQELLKSLLQQLSFSEEDTNKVLSIFSGELITEKTEASLPDNFLPLQAIVIGGFSYDPANKILRFTGIMTDAQRISLLTDPSLAAITGNAAYQNTVDELYQAPRMLIKFFELHFSAPLENLPEAISFITQLDPALHVKVWYDAEWRTLHFNGIMTVTERDKLSALSADPAYLNAVNSLFTQPRANTPEWLADTDLTFPLRDLVNPLNDNQNSNLVTAIEKVLDHLKTTLSDALVIEKFAELTSLRPATIARLFGSQLLLPDPATVLDHFTDNFSVTNTTIDPPDPLYARSYQLSYWSHRVALLINKLKLDLEEVEWLITMHTAIGGLDLTKLPLTAIKPVYLTELLTTKEVFNLHKQLSTAEISILTIFNKLQAGGYAASDFAADLTILTEWPVADILTFTGILTIAYPADFLKVSSWQRLTQLFSILEKLGGSADAVKALANATVTQAESEMLKQLLRAQYDEEAWLQLSTEVQDILRERKRDGLVAYLLTRPMPANAPSGKWENANDLYSYYLVDVEMASCQLTSRMVQGSGSVQLFVQRCFMGLEPQVKVDDTNDSAWKWWKWMKKYRIWEANRKIFLYPENWIEPELRIDRSPFFKDLENELLQNEVTNDTVETAFLNYLEQLDGVSRLEIAGFYHEDDGDKTILHVFGRTPATQPHVYYYRQWDYRRWTAWEKVDLDISEDYLVPTMINKRLYIFWPVFTEVSAEDENKKVDVPDINVNDQEVPQVKKKLKMQLALSEFRNQKWSPKRVSVDYVLSEYYESEVNKEKFRFWAIDKTATTGRFVIYYRGTDFATVAGNIYRSAEGAFEFGCKGVPEKIGDDDITFHRVIAVKDSLPYYLKEKEGFSQDNDFTFLLSGQFVGNEYMPIEDSNYQSVLLTDTPGQAFRISLPWQLSYFDKFFQDVCHNQQKEKYCPFGLWLPFFFEDKSRSFFVLPVYAPYARKQSPGVRLYYPELKKGFMVWENIYYQVIEQILVNLGNYLQVITPANRQAMETFLGDYFNTNPPFSNQQIIDYFRIIYRQYVNFLLGIMAMNMHQHKRYHFKNFYHPFTCNFSKQVYLKGIEGLMKRETQLMDTGFEFNQVYHPTYLVLDPAPDANGGFPFYPRENVDFTPDGSYAPYNWELFYHAPLMIATRLSRNQRFEEAMDWFHYIFNPLDSGNEPVPQKFWITKPFFQLQHKDYVQQRIDNIMRMLAGDTTVDEYSNELKNELEKQVTDWRDHPFDPHIIAQFRIVAYQKTTILKYLDNLIAWGDQLFRQDSMESINEATQLYVLAAEILGPRPKKVPPRIKPPVQSFNELEPDFDSFSNALVDVENLIPPLPPGNDDDESDKAPIPDMLYFCIPMNDKLLGYWDTVADRLFKIRHCMNIEGVERQLALFEPPVDPGMLVRAAAAGLDISSVLADLNAPMPLYRFNILLQKTLDVCSALKGLGNGLLSALEKKDGEALSLIRQAHEIRLLEAVKAVKRSQLEEAKENTESLRKSKITIETRRDYYRDIEKIIQGEQFSLDMQESAHEHQKTAQDINIGASMLGYLPNLTIGGSGFGGSPHLNAQWGTGNIISAMQAYAGAETNLSNTASYEANRALTLAGYDRRFDDWKLQETLAEKEITQIDKQITASEIRISIAEKEIENHAMQIEQAKELNDFMQDKYTNKQLYEWLITQTSQVYFQSYKLAYDLAKKAERCFRHELGLDDSSYIQFGYWDSLKKGLMTGEKLELDLKRMEAAYFDQHKREYELTKHISLAQLNPEALFILKQTGKCFISLPEALFDLDYAGHYMRRIKSVSVTIPCVAGPYTTISCSLRLVKSSIRKKNTLLSGKYERDPDESTENRFRDQYGVIQSIATSHAQNDSGLFELNFKDERYLPFEGAGVISEWMIELPGDFRQFNYDSIADLILHIKYTAREAGRALGNKAMEEMKDRLNTIFDDKGLFRMLSLKQDFPNAWHQLLQGPVNPQTVQFGIMQQYFPYMLAGKDLDMTEVKIFLVPKDNQAITTAGLTLTINEESPAGGWSDFKQTGIKQATWEMTGNPVQPWTIDAGNAGLKNEELDDLLIMIRYMIV